jgi:cytochrome c556
VTRPIRAICLVIAALVAFACSRSDRPSANAPDFGQVMIQVGQRFERMGRAASAGRFELAAFEAGELGELFDRDLPRAKLPKEGKTDQIPAWTGAFARTMPARLKQAAAARDITAFRAAFKAAAVDCNGCHQATGHAFIEIPSELNQPVPRVDPVSGDGGAR